MVSHSIIKCIWTKLFIILSHHANPNQRLNQNNLEIRPLPFSSIIIVPRQRELAQVRHIALIVLCDGLSKSCYVRTLQIANKMCYGYSRYINCCALWIISIAGMTSVTEWGAISTYLRYDIIVRKHLTVGWNLRTVRSRHNLDSVQCVVGILWTQTVDVKTIFTSFICKNMVSGTYKPGPQHDTQSANQQNRRSRCRKSRADVIMRAKNVTLRLRSK